MSDHILSDKKRCFYCGNNPTPHLLTWYSQTIEMFIEPITHRVFGRWLAPVISTCSTLFLRGSFAVFRFLGMLKENHDIAHVASSRGKALWEEATRRGMPFSSFIFRGNHVDIYKAMIKGKQILFSGLPRLDTHAQWWLDDKAIIKKKLAAAGVLVPRGAAFTRFEPMRKMFETLKKPVIVKPRIGSRGRHTTTHISTVEELKKAFDRAKQLCHWVIMEEHLMGSVYRGTVIDGVLAGVLRGDFPSVTGDGIHTIEELVVLKNKQKHPLVHDVVLKDVHKEFLARIGLAFDSILPEGKRVDLLEKIGISYGGYSAEEFDITHPDTKKIFEKAATVVKDPIIGFDFIVEDITKSPYEQHCGIIECNGVPFINLHHYPMEGRPQNVAKHVWDFVEKHIDLY